MCRYFTGCVNLSNTIYHFLFAEFEEESQFSASAASTDVSSYSLHQAPSSKSESQPQQLLHDVMTFGGIEECVEVVSEATTTVSAPTENEVFIPPDHCDAEPPDIVLDADPKLVRISQIEYARHKSPQKTPEMAAEVSVHSSDVMAASTGGASPATSSSSSTDDDSQMSGGYNESDAEIVMLLTLLQKGPNYNPACPSEKTSTSASELAKQRLQGLANAMRKRVAVEGEKKGDAAQPEKGISSSLLAVIEQLRERTSSTSQDTTEADPGKIAARKNSVGRLFLGSGDGAAILLYKA